MRNKTLLISLSLMLVMGLLAAGFSSSVVGDEQENHFDTMLKIVDDYLEYSYQGVITPEKVYESVVMFPDPDYYVVDLRDREDFQENSIIGSVNIPFAEVTEEYQLDKLPKDKKIILVSYSGHTANRVATFWGLLGYQTIALENGFGGWNQVLPCNPADHQLTTEPTEAEETYQLPEFHYQVETLEELVKIRAKKAFDPEEELERGHDHDFGRGLVMARGRESHVLVDLRDPEYYNKGHFGGSINIPFDSLTDRENLSLLPPDKEIMLLCSNGFASSQAAVMLRMLGYEASVSRFGMSILTEDEELIGDRLVICKGDELYPTVETRIDVEEAGPG